MPQPLVFAVLVVCGKSLLICTPVDSRQMAFENPEECRIVLDHLVARQQRLEGDERVVLGRCGYVLGLVPDTFLAEREVPLPVRR